MVPLIKAAIVGIGKPGVELAILRKKAGHVGRPKPTGIGDSLGIDGPGGEDLLPCFTVGRTLQFVAVAGQQIQVAFLRAMQVQSVHNRAARRQITRVLSLNLRALLINEECLVCGRDNRDELDQFIRVAGQERSIQGLFFGDIAPGFVGFQPPFGIRGNLDSIAVTSEPEIEGGALGTAEVKPIHELLVSSASPTSAF